MDLDDFKNSVTKRFPEKKMAEELFIKPSEDLAAEIEAGIKRQRRKLIAVTILHITLSILYFSIISRAGENTVTGYRILGTGCLMASVYLLLKFRSLNNSLFLLPTHDFICKAEKHFTYMKKSDFIISSLLVTILGIGGGLVFVNRLLLFTNNITLLVIIWCVFFVSLSVFGFFASRKDWEKENGKLISDLKNFRKTMA